MIVASYTPKPLAPRPTPKQQQTLLTAEEHASSQGVKRKPEELDKGGQSPKSSEVRPDSNQ
jgi:hypothetical protein